MRRTRRRASEIICAWAWLAGAASVGAAPAHAQSQIDFVGSAIAHDGTEIRFATAGSGTRFLLLGYGTASAADPDAMRPWIEGLGDDFRLIFIDYPGEPKLYTLTPPTVTRDLLAVADEAGANEFAYYGYSWGAVTGLQLAIRTDRLTALIAGGFPMLNGPYEEMLQMVRAAMDGGAVWARDPTSNPEQAATVRTPPELARQYITYYEGLQSLDDTAAQASIRVPRLTFIGTADVIGVDDLRIDLAQTVADGRRELERLGWEVELLDGMNHLEAMAPPVVIPLIRDWLNTRWPR